MEAHTMPLEQRRFLLALVDDVDAALGLAGGVQVGEPPPVAVVVALRRASRKPPVLATAGPLAAVPRSC